MDPPTKGAAFSLNVSGNYMMRAALTIILAVCTFMSTLKAQQDSQKSKNSRKTNNTMLDGQLVEKFSDAVVYGEIVEVIEMLDAHPELVNAQDENGFTALHNVMNEEQNETIALIISKGANVNAQNNEGIGPLHLVGYSENARLLIEAGADINLKDNSANTPLHILASNGEESEDVIRYLLSIGADKELMNKKGQKPIDIALSRAEGSLIEILK